MVGRKVNLKFLISKLWKVGVTIVKTTEFVQGQTCRWGLAWSFVPPARKIFLPHVAEKNNLSFMLEVWYLPDDVLLDFQRIQIYLFECLYSVLEKKEPLNYDGCGI